MSGWTSSEQCLVRKHSFSDVGSAFADNEDDPVFIVPHEIVVTVKLLTHREI